MPCTTYSIPNPNYFLKVLTGNPDATCFMMVHFTKAYPSPHLEHLRTYLSQCISQLLPLAFWCWMLFCRFAHNGIFCTPSGITKKPAWCFVIWTLLRMDLPPLNSQSWIGDTHTTDRIGRKSKNVFQSISMRGMTDQRSKQSQALLASSTLRWKWTNHVTTSK